MHAAALAQVQPAGAVGIAFDLLEDELAGAQQTQPDDVAEGLLARVLALGEVAEDARQCRRVEADAGCALFRQRHGAAPPAQGGAAVVGVPRLGGDVEAGEDALVLHQHAEDLLAGRECPAGGCAKRLRGADFSVPVHGRHGGAGARRARHARWRPGHGRRGATRHDRAMPTLVQFGAGNIGRGFIAPTFAAAGWTVIFVEVAPALTAGLRARGGYRVRLVDNGGERVQEVRGVQVVDGRDVAAVAAALAGCDLAATAVGLNVLPRLGEPIAAGLALRQRPLDVLVCENGATAHELLRAAVLARDPALDARLGCVRTSIGRMIPPPGAGEDPLDIRVEPYAKLPVERGAFRGPVPALPGLVAKDDFDLVLAQKLYLHNLTHACLAYGGHLRGHATIPDCMHDAALVGQVRAVAAAVAEALGRRHGGSARADSLAIAEDLLERYRNRALADPVARVARDPWRKLAADDRLVGAARLCLAQGVGIAAIAAVIADACRYTAAADEPRAEAWNALAPAARLIAAANLTPEDPIMAATAAQLQLAERRAVAATQMRAAGLTLRADEAEQIEIADFGLGRYGELGLAIHVYVNTKRCCAKELMMLPGQICPEHRHPPVEGDPGKEETFRVRQGEVFLHLLGDADAAAQAAALARLPADKRDSVTVFRTVHLKPGDQATLGPNVKHWFSAGAQGAVVSEFSTRSRDEADIFTDAAIRRVP